MPDQITAYQWKIKAQDQSGSKGLDSKMDPPANWTQLEVSSPLFDTTVD